MTQLPRNGSQRARWSWLLAGLIFLCGAAAGAGVTVVVAIRTVLSAARHTEQIPDRLAARIRRRLDLTDAQAAQVKQILAKNLQEFWQIRRNNLPRIDALLDRTQTEVAAVLDSRQAEEWDRRVGRLRERWVQLRPKAPQSMEDQHDGQLTP